MGWLDSFAETAGLKALQAGADMRIAQLAMLDLHLLPAPLRDEASALVATRYRAGDLKVDDDCRAAALKLGTFYAAARREGVVELELVLQAALKQLRQRAGDALGPSIDRDIKSIMGANDASPAPVPPPLPAAPAPKAVDFDQAHEMLWDDYDEGALSDDEYNRRFRALLLDEVGALIDRRLSKKA